MAEEKRALSVDQVRRLTFVKYFLQVGIEQSRRPEPLGCVALLTFHDVTEMFLQILLEHFEAGKRKPPDFLEYWSNLDAVGVNLSHRESMRRFNDARVKLKHRGLRPAHDEIDGFRALTVEFLSESSRNLLGVDFERMSLTNLVRSEKVRALLEKAEVAMGARDWKEALGDAKLAFLYAMRNYQNRPRSAPFPWSQFDLRNSFYAPFVGASLEDRLGHSGRDLVDAIEQMAATLGEAITIVGYNLDFEGYLLFKTHTPVVHEFIGGNVSIEWMADATTDGEIATRCVNFAIDTAIRLESAG